MTALFAAFTLRQMKPFGRFTRTSCSSPETGFTKGSMATSTAPGTRKRLRRPSTTNSIGANTGFSMVPIVLAKSSKGPLPLASPRKMRTMASRCGCVADSET